MTTILILSAAADDGFATAMAPLLRAEGYEARIVNRSSGESDAVNAGVCGIVLWSAASIVSWPVREMAEQLFTAGRLVQVTLDGAEAPHAVYTEIGPVDFSAWRANDRGAIAWRTLRARLERLTDDSQAEDSHFGAIGSLVAASISIMALSTADRVLEGAPSFDLAPRNHMIVADNAPAPVPAAAAGGPLAMDDALEDDIISVRAPRVPSPIRLSAAPPLPELESTFAIDAPRIARPSFLRRVLSAAEGLTQMAAPPPQS